MRRLTIVTGVMLAVLLSVLIACNGGETPPAATLTLSPTSATITAGGTGQTFTATLTNSSATISWSLVGSGSLSIDTGATTTYIPPATVSATETATLTATAGSLSANATITIEPPSPSLSITPATATLVAGGVGQLFTATLLHSTDAIAWALVGSGSLSIDTGASTTYTPPATVAATETATLTATAGSLNASATITIEAPSSITVTGRVLKFNGDPASGVNVQIDDALGVVISTLTSEVDPLVATDPGGNFILSGVTPPYTLSVIPPIGNEVPQTWVNVTRTDPIVVINPFSGAATFCPTPAPGTINVTLTAPVGVGNTGRVYFVGEGISHLELASNVISPPIAAGLTTTSLTVPFDTALCQTTISGKLIFLERNNVSGSIVNTGTADVTVATGNVIAAGVTVLTGTTRSVAGNVNFPVGTIAGDVYLVLKVGGASVLAEVQGVDIADPNFDIAAPELPGVEYRVLTLAGALYGVQLQWAYSDVLTLPALGTNLRIPSLGETITPAGSIGPNTTPTFRFVQITGTNLNYAYVVDAPYTGTVEWLGATQATAIELPVLPAPARLTAGTAFFPNAYAWAPLNSINVRAGGDANTMLDGRQVKKLYFGLFAVFNPDVISAGSYNLNPTGFNIP